MKKRLLLIMFAIVMSLAMLTACGGDKGESDGDGANGGSGEVKIAKNVETTNLSIPIPEGYDDATDEKGTDISISSDAYMEPEKFNADRDFYLYIKEEKLLDEHDDNFSEVIDTYFQKGTQPVEIEALMGGLETKAYYDTYGENELGSRVDIYVNYGEVKNGFDCCKIHIDTVDKSLDDAMKYINESPHVRAVLSGLKFK